MTAGFTRYEEYRSIDSYKIFTSSGALQLVKNEKGEYKPPYGDLMDNDSKWLVAKIKIENTDLSKSIYINTTAGRIYVTAP